MRVCAMIRVEILDSGRYTDFSKFIHRSGIFFVLLDVYRQSKAVG